MGERRHVWTFLAGLAGLTGVILGAFGAHGLQHVLDSAKMAYWTKAVLYHLTHAVALVAVAMRPLDLRGRFYRQTCWGFLGGIVLFSGSLYVLALTGWRPLVWLTPIGGTLFLWGWSALIIASIRHR